MSEIAQRYQNILSRIRHSESLYRRSPGSVNLIAVSKTKPAEMIREMAGLGQQAFGENYLQEAVDKQNQLADLELEWHFIGHIQSNKTREIAGNFSWAHGVDRFKIARRLSDQRPAELPPINICLQVNLENELSKSGVPPDQVLDLAREISVLPNIRLRGLMAIPSPGKDHDEQRQIFKVMKTLLEELNATGNQYDVLSMGMTDDMDAAIAEGATHIRIGTALFGPRSS